MARKPKSAEVDNSSPYDDVVDKLVRENNNLKKRLGKLRKMASKVPDEPIIEEEEDILNPKKSKDCFCGGCFQRVVLLNMTFDVCQSCKRRIKVPDTK